MRARIRGSGSHEDVVSLKTFALIVRRPDIDREEFRRHYEEIHSPLALPLLEGLVRYVKYHLTEEVHGEAGFDVLSGFWYWSADAAMATVGRVEAPEGEAIRADELTFMDKERNTFFAVVEEPRIGSDEGGEGAEHSFVLVKAPEGEARGYLRSFDERAWPGLVGAFATPDFALHHRVLGAGEPSAYDLVTQVRSKEPPDSAALATWAAAEEARGARVVAVRTRQFETETPWEVPG